MTNVQEKKRLASLDALRGMDMFWILGGQSLFAALFVLTGWHGWKVFEAHTVHSAWHGFTFYDLIFPLFIFLSGVAMGLSPKRINHLPFNERKSFYYKATKRLLLLFFLGVLYNHGWGVGTPMAFDEIRYVSVLGRIAIAWFFCVLLVWHLSLKSIAFTGIGILIFYWVLLCFVPVPDGVAGDLSASGSWNAWFDKHLLPGISYQNRVVDPEGVLSSLPAIVNAIAGVFVGQFIVQAQQRGEWKTVIILVVSGLVSITLGWLWDTHFPVNKELWTSSFVLVTIGWSTILLALFYALIDVFNGKRFAYIFIIIGSNSIIIYLASSIVKWEFVSKSLFGGVVSASPLSWQPLLSVVFLLFVQLLTLHWMHKRKIFISV